MRTGYLLLLCFISTVPCFMESPGKADDAPLSLMGGGAAAMPANAAIRMDSEQVTMRLGRDSYRVDAIFHFFNHGPTATVKVGFPKRQMGCLSDIKAAEHFISFETWVDGQKVQFSEEPDSSSIAASGRNLEGLIQDLRGNLTGSLSAREYSWMVKEVRFSGGAKTTTRVKYEAAYSYNASGRLARYIYGTGAYWNDSIGVATFIVDSNAVGGQERLQVTFSESSPPRVSQAPISTNVRSYKIKNFTPADDGMLLVLILDAQDHVSERGETLDSEKIIRGLVKRSSPTSLSVQRTPSVEGGPGEVMSVKVGPRTSFIPFRLPSVGEEVEVKYHDENKSKFATEITVLVP